MLVAISVGITQRAEATSRVTIWPAPAEEKLSEDYTLRINGKPVSVYSCRVSAVPLNQVWPGYQRPKDQTDLAGFAHWGMSGPVKVEVTAKHPFKDVVIRPGARNICPTVRGQRITFTLAQPGQVTVELDGPHHALHLFADPPEAETPKPDAAGVRYFGPGIHRPGKLQLKSNETIYVAGGAVVYTAIAAQGATGVRILGRGIIDTSEFERDQGGGCIRLGDCADVKIDGVILRDPDVWCLSAFGCRNLEISNVKLIGLWRYNADGIDICNSQNVVVRNSFVRAFDDAIVLKGLKGLDAQPVRNVRVHDNVIWCDWGRALEIGAETAAPEFTDICFRDNDIIRTTHIAMDIQCGDRAVVHDVRYENIRVETDAVCPAPKMQARRDEQYVANPNDEYLPNLLVIVIAKNPYSQDAERGAVHDITYQDITVTGRRAPRSFFMGLDAKHTVKNITIENLRFNGQVANGATEGNLALGEHVSDVQWRSPKPVADPGVRKPGVTVARRADKAAPIDQATLDAWSAPYRGWHYYAEPVIPSDLKIPGHENFHSFDVPTVYQLPRQPRKWFMSHIGFNGKGYNSFVSESTNLLQWTNPRLAMGFGPTNEFDHGGCVVGAFLYESADVKAPRVLKQREGKFWTLYGAYPRQGGYELRPGYEGVAVSDDGLTWRRAKSTPILAVQDAGCGAWEKDCIYQPWLVEHRGRFFNFYNAANGGMEQMGLATSTNFLNWERGGENPIVRNRPDGYDSQFCSDGKVFRDGDHWVMFYFGVGRGGAHIMAAFSRDLQHWTAHPEPLYKAGGHPGGLDAQYAHKISLVHNPANDTFYLYYCAVGKDGIPGNKGRCIGLLTSRPLAKQRD